MALSLLINGNGIFFKYTFSRKLYIQFFYWPQVLMKNLLNPGETFCPGIQSSKQIPRKNHSIKSILGQAFTK